MVVVIIYLITVLFNHYSFPVRHWREGTKGTYDFKYQSPPLFEKFSIFNLNYWKWQGLYLLLLGWWVADISNLHFSDVSFVLMERRALYKCSHVRVLMLKMCSTRGQLRPAYSAFRCTGLCSVMAARKVKPGWIVSLLNICQIWWWCHQLSAFRLFPALFFLHRDWSRSSILVSILF